MMCTDFANKLEVNDHPSVIYGNRVSRMLFDQYLALEGSFVK
jgi:beta-lactamase class A